MEPKMPTEYAQMHAGKCESVKSENLKGEREIRKWKGEIKIIKLGKIKLNQI